MPPKFLPRRFSGISITSFDACGIHRLLNTDTQVLLLLTGGVNLTQASELANEVICDAVIRDSAMPSALSNAKKPRRQMNLWIRRFAGQCLVSRKNSGRYPSRSQQCSIENRTVRVRNHALEMVPNKIPQGEPLPGSEPATSVIGRSKPNVVEDFER